MTSKTYSKRSNAARAARAELGSDAQEGMDFRVVAVEGGFIWLEQTASGPEDADLSDNDDFGARHPEAPVAEDVCPGEAVTVAVAPAPKRRSRTPHPVEARDQAWIDSAVEFTATIRHHGKSRTTRHATLAEAAASARLLEAEATNGRKALVYAVTAEGRSAMVPEEQWRGLEMPAEAGAPESNTPAAGVDTLEIPTFLRRSEDERRACMERMAEAAEAERDHPGSRLAIPKTEDKPKVAGTSMRGAWAEREAAARRGELPEPPDFSAPTHARFRKRLAALVELAQAGDADGLRAVAINPISSSPKAMAKYRDLCVLAIEISRSKHGKLSVYAHGAEQPAANYAE